jgi:hypothetical protein
VWVARGANLVILALALAIMTQLSSIQVAWQVSLLLGAGMGVMLVLRWLWWRANANGELAAIVASGLLAPLLLWALPGEQEALRLLAMALGSTAVGVVVTLVTAPEPRERLEAFFARARPPGFWAPVAGNRATEAVARLRNGLAATALAAFSLFCLLAGVGSWMLGSPAPTWLPHAGLWIALLLTVGAGLVPVWWRLAFARVSASD